MSKLSDFPSQRELDEMTKDELNALWKRLMCECDLREGAIACRAFDIGWRMSKKEVDA